MTGTLFEEGFCLAKKLPRVLLISSEYLPPKSLFKAKNSIQNNNLKKTIPKTQKHQIPLKLKKILAI